MGRVNVSLAVLSVIIGIALFLVSGKRTTLMIKTIAIIGLVLVTGWYVFAWSYEKDKRYFSLDTEEIVDSTPFLFQEITIPYLRNKEYFSSLGEIQKISENSDYISYLTSYGSDGLRVNGLLTVPKAKMPDEGWPAVVFVHGYIPPDLYRTTQKYVPYVDYLAKNGFVVFKIDLRGHGDSQGEAGGAYYSSDYVVDTLNAYSALENADFVNPSGIGLWGHSMAGNVLVRSVAVQKDIPAVVIWAGAGYTYRDLLEYRLGDASYRPPPTDTERARKRKLLMDTYGSFEDSSWFWKLVPGTNYLEGVTTAFQLHHAVDDVVVSFEYSRNLEQILKSKGLKNEFYEYNSGGHNIDGPVFSQAMSRTVEFFRNNLN